MLVLCCCHQQISTKSTVIIVDVYEALGLTVSAKTMTMPKSHTAAKELAIGAAGKVYVQTNKFVYLRRYQSPNMSSFWSKLTTVLASSDVASGSTARNTTTIGVCYSYSKARTLEADVLEMLLYRNLARPTTTTSWLPITTISYCTFRLSPLTRLTHVLTHEHVLTQD